MLDYDDYFGGLTEEEYREEMKEHFAFLDHISKCDDEQAFYLLDKFKENLFATEFVSDEDSEMLYHTIISWKDGYDAYLTEEEEL
jgi:hypothetical protein